MLFFVRVSLAVATIWRAFIALNAYAAYAACIFVLLVEVLVMLKWICHLAAP